MLPVHVLSIAGIYAAVLYSLEKNKSRVGSDGKRRKQAAFGSKQKWENKKCARACCLASCIHYIHFIQQPVSPLGLVFRSEKIQLLSLDGPPAAADAASAAIFRVCQIPLPFLLEIALIYSSTSLIYSTRKEEYSVHRWYVGSLRGFGADLS